MPELPEVEIVRRSLEKKVKDKVIQKVLVKNCNLRFKILLQQVVADPFSSRRC